MSKRKFRYKTTLVEPEPLKVFNVATQVGDNIEKFVVLANSFVIENKVALFYQMQDEKKVFIASFTNVVYISLLDEKLCRPKEEDLEEDCRHNEETSRLSM